jgi:tetratricopeptide (TPR) repeat protein
MKKLVIAFLFTALSATALFSQSNDPYDMQNRVYRAALKNYDLQAATIALYNMIALKPEKTDLNDSLALLYFASERYAQAYTVGQEIVNANPKRLDMLELVAVSKQNLGMIKESLADYEKLYSEQKALLYLYQMATLQYQLKRFGECVASLDQIINNADAEKQKVNIRMQNGTQDVPMKAAAYNVKGICAIEMNQEELAKQNFTKALQVFPDFTLAKGNLESLDKKKDEGAGSTTTKTASGSTKTTTVPKKQ